MLPNWFNEKWIKDELNALGLFLAILLLRLEYPYTILGRRGFDYPLIKFKEAIVLRVREDQIRRPYISGLSFFYELYENKKDKNGILWFEDRVAILDLIEAEYSAIFRESYLKFINYEKLCSIKHRVPKIKRILKDISSGVYKIEVKTKAGSVKVSMHPYEVKKRMRILCGEAIDLIYLLNITNISLYASVYPFPVLESEFRTSLC